MDAVTARASPRYRVSKTPLFVREVLAGTSECLLFSNRAMNAKECSLSKSSALDTRQKKMVTKMSR